MPKIDDLVFIKSEKLLVSDLKSQYIPQIFSPLHWKSTNLEGSPHMEILRIYAQNGKNMIQLLQTSYADMFRYWDKIGYNDVNTKRNTKYIKRKIQDLIDLYENMKRDGFDKKYPITVVNKPFWKTRYKVKTDSDGYEIWNGHHRAVCALFLGIKKVPCDIFEDAAPGTMKCKKWDKRLAGVKSD